MFTRWMRRLVALLFILSLFACRLLTPGSETAPPTAMLTEAPTEPPFLPEETLTPTFLPDSPTLAIPLYTPAPQETQASGLPGSRPEESILILEPGPGSVVASPVRVAGVSSSTFEQALAVRLVLADGSVLALAPAQIQADLGERGPFEAEIHFQIEGSTQGVIQVFSESARDGGITHLSSVGVTFAGSGEVQIRPVEDRQERIDLTSPAMLETVAGGIVHVEGVALASFEQTLVVEVCDQEGQVIGMQPVIVSAPDLGQPGPFSADVPYELDAAGPGRVVVRDPSPAFDGDLHLASIEINLEP